MYLRKVTILIKKKQTNLPLLIYFEVHNTQRAKEVLHSITHWPSHIGGDWAYFMSRDLTLRVPVSNNSHFAFILGIYSGWGAVLALNLEGFGIGQVNVLSLRTIRMYHAIGCNVYYGPFHAFHVYGN